MLRSVWPLVILCGLAFAAPAAAAPQPYPVLAERDGLRVYGPTRWGLARSTCGRRIEARTIAVGVAFPRVNWSASLSSATFFVSRARDGWVVWHQAH